MPLVLSIGIGIANSAGKPGSSLSGFGVVTLASLLPILAVLGLALFVAEIRSPDEIIAAAKAMPAASTAAQARGFWSTSPVQEVVLGVRAILPLVVFLLFVLFVLLRERLANRVFTTYGLVLAVIGMCIFNIGLTFGLGAIGGQTGAALPAAFMQIDTNAASPLYDMRLGLVLVISFAWVLGLGATLAEPALNALGLTVQNLTNGAFRKSMLMYSVALGVASGIALGIAKILFGLNLIYLLVPLYTLALVLTFFSTEEFVCVAWDSAGVTTGPVTVPLVLAMGLELGKAVSAVEGFGILSMASIGPIIAVLGMGLFFRFRQGSDSEAEVEASLEGAH